MPVKTPSPGHNQPRLIDARALLAALGEKKGPTIAARLRELWPEISSALARGHRMRAICECLQADDVVISERALAAYVARMRKLPEVPTSIKPMPVSDEAHNASKHGRPEILASHRNADQSADPLETLRTRDDRHQVFDYRPELADPKKLI